MRWDKEPAQHDHLLADEELIACQEGLLRRQMGQEEMGLVSISRGKKYPGDVNTYAWQMRKTVSNWRVLQLPSYGSLMGWEEEDCKVEHKPLSRGSF